MIKEPKKLFIPIIWPIHYIIKKNIIMSNVSDNGRIIPYGRTYESDSDKNATILNIPKEFTKELDIENSRVSMKLLYDVDGDKHLMISKYYIEIIMDYNGLY